MESVQSWRPAAGRGGGALGGVYKLVTMDGLPKLKVTSDISKATLPGKKRVLRAVGPDGSFIQDVICLEHDDELRAGDTVYDPGNPLQHTTIPSDADFHEVRRVVMMNGHRTEPPETLEAMSGRCCRELATLPQGCRRFINPHRYKVSLSGRLSDLRNKLIEQVRKGE